MNFKIISLKAKSKKIREFNKREWRLVHPEHFGSQQNDKYWKRKKFIFKAEENGKISGTLDGDYVAGVMYISQLIVADDKRGLGIGKKLMQDAEKLAGKNKLHLIYLKTGTGWKVGDQVHALAGTLHVNPSWLILPRFLYLVTCSLLLDFLDTSVTHLLNYVTMNAISRTDILLGSISLFIIEGLLG